MSINGIMNYPLRPLNPEASPDEKAPAGQIVSSGDGAAPEGDVIDIKAIKAILYLGIRGEVYLPLEEGHTVNTLA